MVHYYMSYTIQEYAIYAIPKSMCACMTSIAFQRYSTKNSYFLQLNKGMKKSWQQKMV